MKRSDRIILLKIISYCDDVQLLMERFGYDYQTYCSDITFRYATNMCIIQIGELVGRLSEEIIEKNKQIPWRAIKGMRNLHAHDYDNVDHEIVWETLKSDIPALKQELVIILHE